MQQIHRTFHTIARKHWRVVGVYKNPRTAQQTVSNFNKAHGALYDFKPQGRNVLIRRTK